MICATVLESSTDRVLARMLEVAPRADLIEVRADAVPPGELDLAAVLERRPRPVLVTCRPEREGGLWRGDEDARLALLRDAARRGADIDVEWDSFRALSLEARVVSRHDFAGTLDREEALASLRPHGAAIQKFAQTVGDAREAIDLLERGRAEKKPTIAIAMGFPGVASRLLAERYGAPWTYAAAAAAAAPGQLPLDQLDALRRGRRPSPATRALGILGKPVGHSRSPALMNAVFGTLAIDAIYSWLETDDPVALLERARRDGGWLGFSVTIPHKERVLAACRLAPEVRATGAANTIVRSGDEWVAHNTDAPAVAQVLGRAARERGLDTVANLPVDLIGAGGAARACAFALKEAGARVRVWNRTPERARKLAAELGVETAQGVRATGSPRAVVNATSVGMTPEAAASPVTAEAFDAATIALDLVYTPEATRFLALARERGAACASGVDVFVAQARRQLEHWLGRHVAQRVSDEWLAARVRGTPA